MERLAVATTLLASLILSSCAKQTTSGSESTPRRETPVAAKHERTPDEVALLEAAGKGDTETVKSLLERGVDPNAKDPEGRTPLTEAVYNNRADIVKLLLHHGADVFAKKNDGQTPQTIAVSHKDVADLIAEQIRLFEVAASGDNKAVKQFLDNGAYVNVRDPDGRTPLTEACWNNNIATVKLLLDKGANPNAKKNDGATPLSIAKSKGHKEIVELLQKAGAK